MFLADRQTDGTKPVAAFRDFANARKKRAKSESLGTERIGQTARMWAVVGWKGARATVLENVRNLAFALCAVRRVSFNGVFVGRKMLFRGFYVLVS